MPLKAIGPVIINHRVHRPVSGCFIRCGCVDERKLAAQKNVVVCGDKNRQTHFPWHALPLASTVSVVSSARNVGVVIDSRLTMADNITAVCHSAHYHLHSATAFFARDSDANVAPLFVNKISPVCSSVHENNVFQLAKLLSSQQRLSRRQRM